jgi:hypothetical protein
LIIISIWLLGILIGIAAAQRRGFSQVAGAIGGLLLGPLAFLLFFVSGVTRSDRSVKCPHCAEFIKAEAKVCKHCRRDVVPKTITEQTSTPVVASTQAEATPTGKSPIPVILGAVAALVTVYYIIVAQQRVTPTATAPATTTAHAPEFSRVLKSNPVNEQLYILPDDERASALAKVVTEPCGTVIRTFFQGLEPKSRTAFWNIGCSNGRSYAISIAADDDGSTKTIDCKVLRAITNSECFFTFK